MEKNLNSKKFIVIIVLIVIALISMFGVSKVTSSPQFHVKTIQSLDEKKITVMELTAAAAGAATGLALIPSDATTPIANQIAQLSSYLLIVTGVIFLEKMLLTITGFATFYILIPAACLLYIIYLVGNKDFFKNLAIKLAIFGLVLFITIPLSVKVSNIIETTHETSINQTIEEAKQIESVSETTITEETEDEGWFSGLTDKAKDFISSIGNNVSGWIQKGKETLSNFIDAIAVLLITTCVIPIGVLIFIIWIIKIIFGINIPVRKIKKDKVKIENKNNQLETTKELSIDETEKDR